MTAAQRQMVIGWIEDSVHDMFVDSADEEVAELIDALNTLKIELIDP